MGMRDHLFIVQSIGNIVDICTFVEYLVLGNKIYLKLKLSLNYSYGQKFRPNNCCEKQLEV